MSEARLTVSRAEAAEMLGVSNTTIGTMLRTGQLRRIKIGTRTLISRREVVALVDDHAAAQETGRVSEYDTWRNRRRGTR